ncbi:MAG: histidine--tRNA ligase [Verrucomicrobiae bacterium]|nr:histidine--tRNA ligase [Verrucomicrobiae bacterium]
MQTLPGFRDFYPEEFAKRHFIFSKWREVAQRYGFLEYDGPPLESLELYTKKSGEEIVNQLYHFVDKGERAVALRPEMTPTLARMVGARHRDYKKPMKWFSIPQLFRYERQQKGRLREHFQLNADIMGGGLKADVEIIALAIGVLLQLGLTEKDFRVRLSSRLVWQNFLIKLGVTSDKWERVFAVIDKMERVPWEKTEKSFLELELDQNIISQIQNAVKARAIDDLPQVDGAGELRTIIQGLHDFGMGSCVNLDLGIVRGLAYYTDTVFEIFALDEVGNYTGRAVAGGGSYDHLIENLTGVKLSAVGFGMGDVVLGDLLREKNLLNVSVEKPEVFVVCSDSRFENQFYEMVAYLRGSGIKTDYSLGDIVDVKKQFERASEVGAQFVVMVTHEAGAKVEVKNLMTRHQESVDEDKVIHYLRDQLK